MTALAGWLGDIALVRFEWAVLAYFALANIWYLILLAGATKEMRNLAGLSIGHARARLPRSPLAPSISLLVPLRDAVGTAVDRVAALLALHYPGLEVVVIDDGSTDGTVEALREHFNLVPVHPVYRRTLSSTPVSALYRSAFYPNLTVVEKPHIGGRADALNAGLDVANGELVCALRNGMLIEADGLRRIVRPFLENDEVLAAGGTIRVGNEATVRGGRVVEPRIPRNPLAGFQVIESLRSFLSGRLGWNRVGGNLVLAGTLSLFRRRSVIEVGGYASDSDGEDVELVLRLRRRGYETGGPRRVAFVPDPVGWTVAPTTTTEVGRARERDHRILAAALWRHRAVFLNRRYGVLGLVIFPHVVIMELLAPVVELLGVLGLALGMALGVFDAAFAVLFLLFAYGLGAVLTVFTLVMDEMCFERYARLSDRLRLVWWALLEPIGYRQLSTFWRLQGLEKFLRGRPRPSLATPPPGSPEDAITGVRLTA